MKLRRDPELHDQRVAAVTKLLHAAEREQTWNDERVSPDVLEALCALAEVLPITINPEETPCEPS
jgi:hypothetical protein